ncbi:hypothetical protein IU501_23170 [Nocardia otitidiscaviarum]|uniref:hypothetical protein n=1 Tax=Nocardia otitidiscaviarum TaxID=1823 RepID=UPI0004A7299D|nr:hypothetical protein [Nocardia otitidiscaviarum]MBF6135897.1 hypothetical protein [Nocardia otitidiscaviarum]
MSDIDKFPTPVQRELLRVVVAARAAGERDVVTAVRATLRDPPAAEIVASVVAVLDGVGHVPGESLDSLIARLRVLYREAADDEDDYEPLRVDDDRY